MDPRITLVVRAAALIACVFVGTQAGCSSAGSSRADGRAAEDHGGDWAVAEAGGDWAGRDWAGGDWAGGDWAGGDWAGGDWAGGDWAVAEAGRDGVVDGQDQVVLDSAPAKDSGTVVPGKSYYVTPGGAGKKNGSSWANAKPKGEINSVLNTLMGPGDGLILGSGDYSGVKITLSTSGKAGALKYLVGLNTGGGRPVLRGSWSRTSPSSGTNTLISLASGQGFWQISGLKISHAQYAFKTPGKGHSGLQLSDLVIDNCRYCIWLLHVADSLFENLKISRYTKSAMRFKTNNKNLTIRRVVADLSGGDASWWDHSEPLPFGYNVDDDVTNTNFLFEDCVARNHRMNGQASSKYWNGDGWVLNGGSGMQFVRCLSYNNEDGGWDDKSQKSVYHSCVAYKNKRNYRRWRSGGTYTNCFSGMSFKRGGSGGTAGFYVASNNITVSLQGCTSYEDATALLLDGGAASKAILRDSIIYQSSGGNIKKGPGNADVDSSNLVYQSPADTDPKFKKPQQNWDPSAQPDAFDSTAKPALGYSSTRLPP